MFPATYWGSSYWGDSYWPPAGAGSLITWENSRVLDPDRRTTIMTTAAFPPGTYVIMVKAVDRSKNESANAARIEITLTSAFDIVIDRVEEPRWLGTLDDFIRHDVSGLLVPKSRSLASAGGWATFDKYVREPVPAARYEAPEIDLGFDATVRVYAEFEAVMGPGATGVADPRLEIDHRLEAGGYGGFEEGFVGTITARYIKARAKIDTDSGVAALKAMRIVLDVEERAESKAGIAVAAGGTAVTFDRPFHLKPDVDVFADENSPLIATRENVTTAGFTGHLWNTSGSDVGGTLKYTATGA